MTNRTRTTQWIILGTPDGEEARTITTSTRATRASVADAQGVPFARVQPVWA